jgi:hypothetical protein
LFDDVPVTEELCLPRDAQRAGGTGELIHGGVADLTFNDGVTIEHRKPERQALVVVPQNLAPSERHSDQLP